MQDAIFRGRNPHKELVRRGAAWLRNNHPVVLTELSTSAGENPDIIGWSAGFSTLIECKVSRNDFRSDQFKHSRRGGPILGFYRYYLVPAGLIDPDECPVGWGLLVTHDRTIRIIHQAPQNVDRSLVLENRILVSALRRCRTCLGLNKFMEIANGDYEPPIDINSFESKAY